VGWVTSPGSPGWINASEVWWHLWVELLVLEALVGTNTLKPWKAWVETNMMMVLSCPTMRWNHCLMGWYGWPLEALNGFGLMCFMRPTFMLGIWHGGDWMKRVLAQPCLQPCGSWKCHNWLCFTSLIWGYFSLFFYEYCIGLYVDHMVLVSLVFLWLLRWLWSCIMKIAMYGSQYVFTCKWMKNVFMA